MSTRNDLQAKVKIGNIYVGEGEPTYFIAEVGNNHNGDYFLAKRTIKEAVKAGANAVKLQKRSISDVFAKELRDKPQTKDQVLGKTYGQYRAALELSFDEFVKLKKYTEGLGATFFATPFDFTSTDFLEQVGVDVYKIASFDVTNIPLLEYVAKKGKPIFLSSGMCTTEELDEAVDTILKHNNQLIIKHCVAAYPTPDKKLNLNSIKFLQKRYSPIPIGYSGHEQDILPTLSAITLGAKSIERHITLNKALPGPDHATVSVEPKEFRRIVEGARRIENALGTVSKDLYEEEIKTRKKHAKSIVSKMNIPTGTKITAEMVMCKSPGYGMKPNMLGEIIGKKVSTDIPEDTVVKHEDIMWES